MAAISGLASSFPEDQSRSSHPGANLEVCSYTAPGENSLLVDICHPDHDSSLSVWTPAFSLEEMNEGAQSGAIVELRGSNDTDKALPYPGGNGVPAEVTEGFR